jgi:hypothetical protein
MLEACFLWSRAVPYPSIHDTHQCRFVSHAVSSFHLASFSLQDKQNRIFTSACVPRYCRCYCNGKQNVCRKSLLFLSRSVCSPVTNHVLLTSWTELIHFQFPAVCAHRRGNLLLAYPLCLLLGWLMRALTSYLNAFLFVLGVSYIYVELFPCRGGWSK